MVQPTLLALVAVLAVAWPAAADGADQPPAVQVTVTSGPANATVAVPEAVPAEKASVGLTCPPWSITLPGGNTNPNEMVVLDPNGCLRQRLYDTVDYAFDILDRLPPLTNLTPSAASANPPQ